MIRKPFTAEQFQATQWRTKEDKAKFGNDLVRFIEAGCRLTMFNKPLYTALSFCYGHIAHFNRYGFYERWFSSPEAKQEWIEHVKGWTIYGDPTWTLSDVERAVQRYARENW